MPITYKHCLYIYLQRDRLMCAECLSVDCRSLLIESCLDVSLVLVLVLFRSTMTNILSLYRYVSTNEYFAISKANNVFTTDQTQISIVIDLRDEVKTTESTCQCESRRTFARTVRDAQSSSSTADLFFVLIVQIRSRPTKQSPRNYSRIPTQKY